MKDHIKPIFIAMNIMLIFVLCMIWMFEPSGTITLIGIGKVFVFINLATIISLYFTHYLTNYND